MNASVTLRELVRHMPVAVVEGPLNRPVAGLAHDCRRVAPGAAYFSLPDAAADRGEPIPVAVERGAAAVICERNGFVPQRATKVRVKDTRLALAGAAAAFHGYPSRALKVVGITGTTGRACAAFMLRSILAAGGMRSGLVSSIHHELGERELPTGAAEPEALELQQMLAEMVRSKLDACVMEVSGRALEQHRVAAIEFDLAVFTHFAAEQFNEPAQAEQMFGAKKRLFSAVAAGTKRGGAVINIDDPYGERLARESFVEVQVTYGLAESARLRAIHVELGRTGTTMIVEGRGLRFACRLGLPGRHRVYSALAAIGAALQLRVPVQAICAGLASLKTVPGQLEPVKAGQPFPVFVDRARTAGQLRQVLRAVRELTPGRVLLAVGSAAGGSVEERAALGRTAAEMAEIVMLTSDNPRQEPPEQIAAQMAAGCRAVREDGFWVENDRARAIAKLVAQAGARDAVVIAGKGHEAWQELATTIVPSDDREHAAAGLAAVGFQRPGRN
jgi:UDP-N-acetylmuramoyl-L-alanyl-D-glutamate--2,6-diaminopimelate ligase